MSDEVRAALGSQRVLAIVRYPTSTDLSAVIAALAAGGMRVVEITMNTPGAWVDRPRVPSDVLLGAGTVTSTAEVHRVADLGARFVVSPGLDLDVVAAARERGLPAIPGVATATEVLAARRAGAEYLKLFPAGALGPRYLGELRGPFADEAFVPTGGVGIDDVPAWLAARAFAVGLGSSLVGSAVPDDLDELTDRARAALRAADGERPQ
jgi:2-dehydro-3-deoxyphosphogluconate aldolase / (4S)-4-hydroxy-2-oxoglutarate aldolase